MKILIIFLMITHFSLALDYTIGLSYKQAGYSEGNDSTKLVDQTAMIMYDEPVLSASIELIQDIYVGYIGAGASYEQGYKIGTESFDALPVYGILKINIFPGDIQPYIHGKYGKTYYQNVEGVTLVDGEFYSVGAGIKAEGVILEISVEAKSGERNGVKFVNGGVTFAVKYSTKGSF